MISKNRIKLIKSLDYKKHRQKTGLFLAEGDKTVGELLRSTIEIHSLIATAEFIGHHKKWFKPDIDIIVATPEEIKKASLLQQPQSALAICRIPEFNISKVSPTKNLVLCFDEIQDPGNLGTIVRIADWFGISDIVCSENSVDIYNPKTVQATMGSVCRVATHYANLKAFLSEAAVQEIYIAGAFTDGDNLYTTELPASGIIVLGNEGRGISEEMTPFITHKLSIPPFNTTGNHAESLNVAIATAVICAEFRRQGKYA